MAKLDFQINKPTEVSEDNLTDVVNDIYDAINRLAQSTDKFIAKSLPEDSEGTDNSKIRIVDDHNSGEVKISVKVGGQWYTTTSLEKEN